MPTTVIAVFCIGVLGTSLWKFRNIAHPHFIFTLSWVYLLPLGVLVSPKVPSYLSGISDITGGNAEILCFLGSLFLLTLFSPENARLTRIPSFEWSFQIPERHAVAIGIFGTLVLAAEFLKQLKSSGWSIVAWAAFSLGPRFGRPWGVEGVGGDDYFRRLASALFPLASVSLPLALVRLRGVCRWIFAILWLLSFAIQVSDGSRTAMALNLGCLALAVNATVKQRVLRRFLIAGLLGLFITTSAVMVSMRGVGLEQLRTNLGDRPSLEYSQDDNYYQLLSVLSIDRLVRADPQNPIKHWSPAGFLGAVLVNPIPRFFWPAKPLLTEDFYGAWKLEYITISWAGEMVAMFGALIGLSLSALLGYLLYIFLCRVYCLCGYDYGAFLYLCMAFYVYMVMRSLHNIGMYMLFAFAAWLVFRVFGNYCQTRGKRPVRSNEGSAFNGTK